MGHVWCRKPGRCLSSVLAEWRTLTLDCTAHYSQPPQLNRPSFDTLISKLIRFAPCPMGRTQQRSWHTVGITSINKQPQSPKLRIAMSFLPAYRLLRLRPSAKYTDTQPSGYNMHQTHGVPANSSNASGRDSWTIKYQRAFVLIASAWHSVNHHGVWKQRKREETEISFSFFGTIHKALSKLTETFWSVRSTSSRFRVTHH